MPPAGSPLPRFAATRRERLVSALASALILGGIAAVLVAGLRPPPFRAQGGSLVAITAATERLPRPRPPAPPPRPRHSHAAPAPLRAAGEPAPRAVPAAIPAPAPPVLLVLPPVTTASRTDDGAAPGAGAAEAGSGSGAAGPGSGPGGGGSGGSGGGPASGKATRARQTAGHLSPRDVPDGLIAPGGQASVGVRFTITPAGRAAECRVIRSSGVPQVDAVPCPLIEARYRFRPARDRAGRSTPDTLEETHTWFEPEPR